jgi:predicted nucleic acid-binding protein
MTAEYLVDTNVLVYAYDHGEPKKQAQAVATLRHLVAAGKGRLSAQVLAEFYRATTAKIAPALTPVEAHRQVDILLRTWPVVPITPLIVLEAARGVRDHRMAYWDAQIWATARLNQIPVVLSEDFTTGAVVEGVRFMNPFARQFDLAMLI